MGLFSIRVSRKALCVVVLLWGNSFFCLIFVLPYWAPQSPFSTGLHGDLCLPTPLCIREGQSVGQGCCNVCLTCCSLALGTWKDWNWCGSCCVGTVAFLDQDLKFLLQAGEGKGGRFNSCPKVKHKQIHWILLCGFFFFFSAHLQGHGIWSWLWKQVNQSHCWVWCGMDVSHLSFPAVGWHVLGVVGAEAASFPEPLFWGDWTPSTFPFSSGKQIYSGIHPWPHTPPSEFQG